MRLAPPGHRRRSSLVDHMVAHFQFSAPQQCEFSGEPTSSCSASGAAQHLRSPLYRTTGKTGGDLPSGGRRFFRRQVLPPGDRRRPARGAPSSMVGGGLELRQRYPGRYRRRRVAGCARSCLRPRRSLVSAWNLAFKAFAAVEIGSSSQGPATNSPAAARATILG